MSDANGARLERGMTMRRLVLGDSHMDRSLRYATEFTRPIQEFVTEFCWGDIWSRPAWNGGPGA